MQKTLENYVQILEEAISDIKNKKSSKLGIIEFPRVFINLMEEKL